MQGTKKEGMTEFKVFYKDGLFEKYDQYFDTIEKAEEYFNELIKKNPLESVRIYAVWETVDGEGNFEEELLAGYDPEGIEDLIFDQGEFMGQSYVITDRDNFEVVKAYILSFDDSVEYIDYTEEKNDQIRLWFY
jgi:hypothetical protein